MSAEMNYNLINKSILKDDLIANFEAILASIDALNKTITNLSDRIAAIEEALKREGDGEQTGGENAGENTDEPTTE